MRPQHESRPRRLTAAGVVVSALAVTLVTGAHPAAAMSPAGTTAGKVCPLDSTTCPPAPIRRSPLPLDLSW